MIRSTFSTLVLTLLILSCVACQRAHRPYGGVEAEKKAPQYQAGADTAH